MPEYLSIDLGAESGRIVRGKLESGRLNIEEAARIPNGMVRMNGRLHWNVLGLFSEIKRALFSISEPEGIAGVGVDSWGIDFVLLDRNGSLAGLPVAYRDSRTDGAMEKFFKLVPREIIYKKTGIQFLQINTLYQLFAMSQQKSPQLSICESLLFIPDFFNYLFTGEKCSEFTIATTSQFFNVNEKTWDAELMEAAGISPGLMQRIVPPGTIAGYMTNEMMEETRFGRIPVIAPASHDTGSAVAAAPAFGRDWAFISSGTWSIMGVETEEPILSDKAQKLNFSNEGGVGGTYRFLKNIMGMWIIQRIRRDFNMKYDYGELAEMAEAEDPLKTMININDYRWLNPPSMTKAISEFCKDTRQPAPCTPGAYARTALESLALEYRVVLDQLREAYMKPVNRIHVMGGGCRNALLCRMTANATGLPVLAGPTEATSIGNLLVQSQTLGHINSLKESREIVRRSFDIIEYEPSETDEWMSALERYLKIRDGCG